LRPAEDAVVIDSTALSAHEVLELALQHVASRGIESETSE
jgi:cytidylate kinase